MLCSILILDEEIATRLGVMGVAIDRVLPCPAAERADLGGIVMHGFPYIIELLSPKRSPAEKVDRLLDRFAARFRQIMVAGCGVSIPDNPMGQPRLGALEIMDLMSLPIDPEKVIMNLIEEGFIPTVLWEGDCTSRLETIRDIPKGKAIYWFEQTDIFKAKDILGDTVCIRGNVPATLLCIGNPGDVETYCKKLIDVVGKGGGFILDGAIGIPDDARPENVKVMADTTRKYGVYG